MKHTLRQNILSTAIAGSLMLASGASLAATLTPTVTVETLADVTIAPVGPVDFGDQLTGAAGSVCTMVVSEQDSTNVGVLVVADDVNMAFSGTGCPAASAALTLAHLGTKKPLAGVYTISAILGQAVTVTVAAGAAANWTYEPIGYLTINDALVDHSVQVPVDSSTPGVITGGTIGVQLVLGGDITVGGTALAAGISDNTAYTITAVY